MPPPSGNRWTAEEDRTLKELVARHSTRWKTVAQLIGTKTDSQCARRWENRFVPRKPRDWTAEEDLALVAGHKTFGKKWKRIAMRIGSRSADAARNRWVSLVKRMPLLERNHEYDAILAQAEVSSPQRSSSMETGSQSSESFSTCNHRDAGGTAISADNTPVRARTPASRSPAVGQEHEEVEGQAAAPAPVTPPQALSLMWRASMTAGQPAPAVKMEAPVAVNLVKNEPAFPVAVDLVKHEPPYPRWLPDDSSLTRYAQAPSFRCEKGTFEQHPSITSLFKGPLGEPARNRLCNAAAELFGPAMDDDADFDIVDWIPETIIAGGDGALWHSQWATHDMDLFALACSHQ